MADMSRILARLQPKERDVARLVAMGLPNKQIAERLHTTVQVVKNYCHHIYDLTGCDSKLELAVWLTREREDTQDDIAAQAVPDMTADASADSLRTDSGGILFHWLDYSDIPNPKMCQACVEGTHSECSYKYCACRQLWHSALIPSALRSAFSSSRRAS